MLRGRCVVWRQALGGEEDFTFLGQVLVIPLFPVIPKLLLIFDKCMQMSGTLTLTFNIFPDPKLYTGLIQ